MAMLQQKRGTTAKRLAYTPAAGELIYDTELNKIFIGDGATPGGVSILADVNIPVFSASGSGLVPARVGAVAAKYLREDGTWVTPTNTTYSAMTQAEVDAGTGTKARIISPSLLKSAVLKHAPESGLGIGQTYQNLLTSRAFDVTYTNTTNRSIFVMVSSSGGSKIVKPYVNDLLLGHTMSTYNIGSPKHMVCFIVPPGSTYKVTGDVLDYWTELR